MDCGIKKGEEEVGGESGMIEASNQKDLEIEKLKKEIERLDSIRIEVMDNYNDLLMVYRKAINNPEFGNLY